MAVSILPSPDFVSLRQLTIDDRQKVRKWLSDPYILRLTFVVPGPGNARIVPFTRDGADQYLNTLIYDRSRFTFAIEVNNEHVGNIGLKEYNPVSRTAECFIEIGEESCRGRGVGTAAMAILLDHGFFNLKLDEVRLEVLEFNDVAIRVYDRLGFKKTHQTGWHYDHNGQYWQVWGMRIDADHWKQKRDNLWFRSVSPIPIRP